jgi:Tol biopolymer transport system component
VAETAGDRAGRPQLDRRWAWLATLLGGWVVAGVALASWALNSGAATDVGISPYHIVGYAGLLALLGVSIWLAVRARARGGRLLDAFPPGLGSIGAGAAVLLAYVLLDVAWREGVGIGPGIENSVAPSRIVLAAGLVLVAMAPLRAALLHRDRGSLAWPATISAGLVITTMANVGGFSPIGNPWLERPPDVTEDNSEIWLMDADGGRQTRLVEAQPNVQALLPAWSPDGSQIAFARLVGPADDPSKDDYDIWIVSADGTDARPAVTGPSWQWLPRWSPDGAWIDYTDEAPGGPWLSSGPTGPQMGQGPQGPVFPAADATGLPEAELWRVSATGGTRQRITDVPGDDRSGSWSPDSKRLVFDSTRDGNTELYAIDADGSNAVRLTDNAAGDWAPSWSPDGSRIAFTSDRTGTAQIWVMAADGSGQAQLSNDPTGALWPAWSPDGTRILFTGWSTGGQQAWSMAADGSDARNLSRSPSTIDATWDGSWGRDGRIVFSRAGPAPAALDPIARQDLGVAAMLLNAFGLALIVGLLLGVRPPFGAVAVALGVSTALVATQSGGWRFIPAAMIVGLLVDVVVRFAPDARRVPLGAAVAALGLVAAVAGGVAVTSGIGWSPTLLVGVSVAVVLGGWAIGALIERHAFRDGSGQPARDDDTHGG